MNLLRCIAALHASCLDHCGAPFDAPKNIDLQIRLRLLALQLSMYEELVQELAQELAGQDFAELLSLHLTILSPLLGQFGFHNIFF